MSANLRVFSNSELKTWRRCPRLHFLSYELGFRPVEKARALELGTLVHVGLETWLRAKQSCATHETPSVDLALSAIDTLAIKNGADPFLVIQAEELMLGYHCRWADAPMEVLAVEAKFDAPVCDPILGTDLGFRLQGKLDAVVKVGADVFIMEHKTSSQDFSPGSYYWERTRLDSQIGLYFIGARSLGFQPAGCLYDVIGKPKELEAQKATPEDKRKYTKPTKNQPSRLYAGQRETDETPAEYQERLRAAICAEPGAFYARAQVVRLAREIEEATADMASTIDLMAQAGRIGLAPRNVDSCFHFGRRCEFFDSCTTGVQPEVGEVFRKAKRRHEELED